MEEHKRNEKLFTRKEVEEKMQIMAQKEKERLCKINQAKLEQMENYSLEFRCKPYMSKMSSRIWK